MKIAFPTQENNGVQSPVYSHFGSASYFVVIDTDQPSSADVMENKDKDHIHGQCQPIAALGGQPVDAVVVGGIGRGALMKLMNEGIKTFRAVEGTVKENLDLITNGQLPAFTMEHTCAGHSGQDGCIH